MLESRSLVQADRTPSRMDLDPLASCVASEIEQCLNDPRSDPVVPACGDDVHRLDVAMTAIWRARAGDTVDQSEESHAHDVGPVDGHHRPAPALLRRPPASEAETVGVEVTLVSRVALRVAVPAKPRESREIVDGRFAGLDRHGEQPAGHRTLPGHADSRRPTAPSSTVSRRPSQIRRVTRRGRARAGGRPLPARSAVQVVVVRRVPMSPASGVVPSRRGRAGTVSAGSRSSGPRR